MMNVTIAPELVFGNWELDEDEHYDRMAELYEAESMLFGTSDIPLYEGMEIELIADKISEEFFKEYLTRK